VKTFVRLQEEIVKRSHAFGIFDFSGRASSVNGCLVHSPSCFSEKRLERKNKKKKMGARAENIVLTRLLRETSCCFIINRRCPASQLFSTASKRISVILSR